MMGRLQWIIIILLISTPALADGPTEACKASLTSLWQVILETSTVVELQDKRLALRAILEEHFDSGSFYRRALKDHWAAWSPIRRWRFSAMFGARLNDALINYLQDVTPDIDMAITGASTQANQVTLKIVGTRVGRSMMLGLYFQEIQSRWMLTDVAIEDALLSRQYRGQFNRILRHEGYESLLAKITTQHNGDHHVAH